MTREFALFSRLGKTEPNFNNLHDAGRLDIVYECTVAALFLSHGLRKNVVFNAFLNGPPSPPLRIRIDGQKLYDVRTDIETWQHILKKTIGGKTHPGIVASKTSFEAYLKEKAENASVFVLEEGGKSFSEAQISEDCIFILGDHVGLPKKTETFAMRFGQKISLGKQPYLAASCINIINFLLDQKRT